MRRPSDSPVSLREAVWFWLKLGCISFGGPAGQIALMHRELVEQRAWIAESTFLHALNYCMLLPGPEAQQLATYLGWRLHGTWGGILAGTLFVLPACCLLVLLSWLYLAQGQHPWLLAAFYGIKPAVTVIVAQAAWRIGQRSLTTPALASVAVAAWLALAAVGLGFPWVIGGAALFGLWAGRYRPAFLGLQDGLTVGEGMGLTNWRPQLKHMLRMGGLGVGLWAASLFLLHRTQPALLGEMGGFFTRAALLTFGGAYAVLPYVQQAVVDQFGWLDAAQMIDGLALGESTPGPLIIIVAFVGFLAAWQQAIFGPEALLLAGVSGALVATWFTFLPSFVFILVGGPVIEATQGRLGVRAPLTAITAAVVGVIANLALFFAREVFWTQGHVDLGAVGLAALAAVALFRLRLGVLPVLAGAALGGLLLRGALA